MTDQETAAPAAEAATPVELKSRAVPSEVPVAEAPKPEPVKAPEPVAEAETDEDDHDGGTTDESATSDGDGAPAKPKNKGVGKRINELTREKHDAIRERDYWKEEALKGNRPAPDPQQQPAQADVQETGEPTLESCDFDVAEFTRKHYQWSRDKERKQEQAQTRLTTLREKEAAFVAENPDYEAVAKAPHVPVTQVMAEAMLDADNAPAIAYYLGQHLDEAAAIAKQSPLQAAISIGRIAERLSAPTPAPEAPRELPKKTTNAPPPPKTVSGAGKPQVSEDDPNISTAQRIALWKKTRTGTRS